MDTNFAIDPMHAEFGLIRFLPSVPFRFDPRLKAVPEGIGLDVIR